VNGSIRFGNHRIRLLRDVPRGFVESVCRGDFHARPGVVRMPSGKYSRVFRFSCGNEAFMYKQYLNRGPLEAAKAVFRGSRAQRSLAGDLLLHRHGFSAPRGVAIGNSGGCPFTVTEYIQNASSLIHYVQTHFSGAMDRAALSRKRTLARYLGDLIGRMHAAGIRHGDLRWGNLMVRESGEGTWEVFFLDNERTRKFRKMPFDAKIKNLVQLNLIPVESVTRTDRMRFFESYLEKSVGLAGEKHHLIEQVLIRTRHREAVRFLRRSETPGAGPENPMNDTHRKTDSNRKKHSSQEEP
jgi:tRNA A-37 threonylcarbamoyl transferase component Bud32